MWFKVDDQFHGHPKTRRASLAAIGLWTVAGTYCMAYKTDGFVDLPFVLGYRNGRKLAAELVAVGYWREDEEGNGWWFHDWLDWQPSSTEIESARANARDRQRKSREARRNRKTGRLEKASDPAARHAAVTRDRPVTSHVSHTTPARPGPARTPTALPYVVNLTSSQDQRTSGSGSQFGLGSAA